VRVMVRETTTTTTRVVHNKLARGVARLAIRRKRPLDTRRTRRSGSLLGRKHLSVVRGVPSFGCKHGSLLFSERKHGSLWQSRSTRQRKSKAPGRSCATLRLHCGTVCVCDREYLIRTGYALLLRAGYLLSSRTCFPETWPSDRWWALRIKATEDLRV
jgi:hypothetical protein